MVHFTAICKLCLGGDGQITCNPSRRIWGLLWVRRRKDHIFQGQPGPGRHTGPSKAQVGRSGPLAPPAHDAFPGVRSLAGPHPPGMIMLPQAEGSVRFKTLETTRVTEQTLWVFLGQPPPCVVCWGTSLKHPGTVCAIPQFFHRC